MLVRTSETHEMQNSASCTVWEYDLGQRSMGCAKAHIDGRYPEEHQAMNEECDQLFFVLGGEGTMYAGGESAEMQAGDAYALKKGTSYWVEGRDLSVLLVNTPPWTPEQYKTIA